MASPPWTPTHEIGLIVTHELDGREYKGAITWTVMLTDDGNAYSPAEWRHKHDLDCPQDVGVEWRREPDGRWLFNGRDLRERGELIVQPYDPTQPMVRTEYTAADLLAALRGPEPPASFPAGKGWLQAARELEAEGFITLRKGWTRVGDKDTLPRVYFIDRLLKLDDPNQQL